MIQKPLRGHLAQLEMFRRAISRNRTAHAYLFVGPSGIGKSYFARLLAQCLFCQQYADQELQACHECSACRQVIAGTHPDLLLVGCPEGKRELPISLIAGEKENRGKEGLCHDLALRPMSAERRIAVVDDAETMNEESANAFLKTLEEPPRGAILFLIAPDIDQILPTIRSRCQLVRFFRLSDDDIAELLLENGDVHNPEQARAVAAVAHGSLTVARQLLDPGLFELKKVVEGRIRQLPIDSLASVQAISAVLDDLGSDTASQRQNMRWANQFCIEQLQSMLRTQSDPVESDRLAVMLDRCFEAEQHLNQTMPVPLCLEALFDDLARISRTPIAFTPH